ncbi:MAG TPA: thioesterase domain-containing protein [Kofleriaceae bacterium]
MKNPNPWVLRRRIVPRPRLRLFLFAHGGGGAGSFLGWDARFPADIELCSVQLPGREARFAEPRHTRLDALVAAAAPALAPLTDVPFAIFGHSMGSLVGYEVCRHWRSAGIAPAYFFASAYPGPRVARHHEPGLHTLGNEALVREMRRLGGLPREVVEAPELLELCLPVVRADFEVCETWRPIPTAALSCPVLAVAGYDDAYVDGDGLDAWRDETTGKFTRVMLAGDHFYHLNAATRGPLLDVLVASLDAVAA